jgi:hypothetical protein
VLYRRVVFYEAGVGEVNKKSEKRKAWAEYEKVCGPALAEYEKRLKEIEVSEK